MFAVEYFATSEPPEVSQQVGEGCYDNFVSRSRIGSPVKGLFQLLVDKGNMHMGDGPALFGRSSETTRHTLRGERHVHFRARRDIFVNQAPSLTVSQNLSWISILHVQNVIQRCGAFDLSKSIETDPMNFAILSLVGAQGVIQLCPLKRHGWGSWRCQQNRRLQRSNTEMISETLEVSKVRSIFHERTLSPKTEAINHPHSLQHQKAEIRNRSMKLSA